MPNADNNPSALIGTENHIPENVNDRKILTATFTPHILERGKFFRDGVASEFHDLKYSIDMDRDSSELYRKLPVSLNNLNNMVTFGYWPSGHSVAFIQTMNLFENRFGGSGTDRPFVQKRFGLVEPKLLIDLYASGIRPLASVLVDSDPKKMPYLLQEYNSVPGQTDERWTATTRLKDVWDLHQNEMYRQVAIRTTEAVLTKQSSKVGNPVVLEHTGELTPKLIANLLDTINILSMVMNPSIATLSAISAASLDNYSNADLVVRDVRIKLPAALYPSYIVNRDGKTQEILPGHYSTPPFQQVPGVLTMYDKLHGSLDNWVRNHELTVKRS